MSTPPQRPYRVLERSRSDRIVGGVCGGVANYLNMDPTLVRVLTVMLAVFTGVPVFFYLIALFVIPEEGDSHRQGYHPPVDGPPMYNPYPYQPGQPTREPDFAPGPGTPSGPRQYGVPPTPDDQAVWGPAGAPWQQPPPPAPPPAQPPAEGPSGGPRR
ncbi:MAG TPA: PspC domain-containing protein [Propionibacteriaceae bacterium]|nr:PspC domain-containing protein [Propionibacteriaceae bacterium]